MAVATRARMRPPVAGPTLPGLSKNQHIVILGAGFAGLERSHCNRAISRPPID